MYIKYKILLYNIFSSMLVVVFTVVVKKSIVILKALRIFLNHSTFFISQKVITLISKCKASQKKSNMAWLTCWWC